MNTSLSMSALRYAPDIFTTATSYSFYASITAGISIASVDTVGDVASALLYFSRCLLLSLHPCALIVPSLSYFRNISISIASLFCASFMSSALKGPNASGVCSYSNSFVTAARNSRLYVRISDFIDKCGSVICTISIKYSLNQFYLSRL